MRVVVLRNSIAGRGAGRRAVDQLIDLLRGARHEPRILDVNRAVLRDEALAAALRSADALIIAGGDGTLHHAAPLAIEANVPLVHFPMGTENLFAREFGFSRNPATILAAIDRARPRRVDVGHCDGRAFMLMGSVGFDACIVERVAANRRAGISRGTYARHAAAEFLRPRFVPLTIRVDGRDLVSGAAGMVVIANSRQYAARLDPARAACMTDGVLDVVFLPIRSRLGIVRRALQVMTGAHMRDATNLHARGAEITITPEAATPLQLDGEHAGLLPMGKTLRFEVRPGVLSVFA